MPNVKFISLDEARNMSKEDTSGGGTFNILFELLESAMTARAYGIDPSVGVGATKPQLYSDFDWRRFAGGALGEPLAAADVGAPEE